jgi:hypothetical protein
MTDPFYPAERRMKWYIIGAFCFASFLPHITLGRGMNSLSEHSSDWMEVKSTTGVIVMSLFYFFAISSSVMAVRLTTRPGISSELRKQFAFGRILYLSFYLITWISFFMLNFYVLFLTTVIESKFSLS